MVIDGQTGFFIEQPLDLSSKIEQLQTNTELWEQLSNNSKQLITDKFSSEINCEKWIDVFNVLTAGKQHIGKVKIPFRVKLPTPNPYFNNDLRDPGFASKAVRKLARTLKIKKYD